MDKSPEAFRTISEVADWLGTPTHVLRFWESRFTQVKPVKRAGGRRYYRPRDMELLGGIKKLLHDDGMTIRGVQKLLREEGVRHVSALSPRVGPDTGTDDDLGEVIDGQAQEAPMAVDVPPDHPQNVVPIKAKDAPAASPAPAALVAAPTPAGEPELGPRGDTLVGPEDTPVTYRAAKGTRPPFAPPTALGNDVPADPGDSDSRPPETARGAAPNTDTDPGSIIGALRHAKASNGPNIADPKAASDIYRRLSALQKRMQARADGNQAD